MPQPDPFTIGLADPDAVPPPPPAPAPARRPDSKAELEAAMAAAPADTALRQAYFDLLKRTAAQHTGLIWAMLPELNAPLCLRGATPDITALAYVFRDDGYALEMRATPQRILQIGAHVGYATVDLARRHPRATVLCAEPLADNLRLLSANTAPYRNIRVAATAVWHGHTRLAPAGRFQGDWAVRLSDEAMDAERTIPAIPVAELMGRAGWPHPDMVVCDAAGSERELFADPLAPWLQHLDVALVRCYDNFAAGGAALVGACFPPELFEHRGHGLAELFLRRVPLTALPDLPPELPLLRSTPGTTPFRLHDVAGFGWAFFVFNGSSCQLHPNPPDQPPARASFPLRLDGHTRLVAGLHHAGRRPAGAVTFTALVAREDGTVLGRAEATVAARDTGKLALTLPGDVSGPAVIVLQTEMAAEAKNNQMAWARFVDPTLI